MVYIVYTLRHRMFVFYDIFQARRFRKKANEEGNDTWYLAEAPIMSGINEGDCEEPARQIDRAKFPK